MNIITVSKYEDIPPCPICQEQFQPHEMIILIQHRVSNRDDCSQEGQREIFRSETPLESRKK